MGASAAQTLCSHRATSGIIGEMPGNEKNSQDSSCDEQVRTELRAIFEYGFFDVDAGRVEHLRSLGIFGGSAGAPISLLAFRDAFREFLIENEELAGAINEIAGRLLGIDQLWRNSTREGREEAAGEVLWEGKKHAQSSVRRRGTGRRDRVLDRIAVAITLAEEARALPASPDSLVTTNKPQANNSQESVAPAPSVEAASSRRRWPVAVVLACMIGLSAYLAVTLSTPSTSHANHHTGGYVPANRPIFRCIRQTNCPGPAYPIFNSYTNAPNYGDERDFLNARPLNTTRFANKLEVKSGEEVLLRVYYDNDSEPRIEPYPGSSTARDTRVAVLLPNARASTMNIAANITAANTRPRAIGDTVTFYSKQPFDVIYVAYSARLWNRAHPSGLPLPSRLVTGDGTLIGYEKMDGNIAGCFCQSGLITLRVLIE